MPFDYLEDIATADIAFSAWEKDLAGLFLASWDAVLQVMVDDIESISRKPDSDKVEVHEINLHHNEPDMLLYDFLGELIYYKDAKNLLLRPESLSIEYRDSTYTAKAKLRGVLIEGSGIDLGLDVKAITFHLFEVRQNEKGWEARVVLDV